MPESQVTLLSQSMLTKLRRDLALPSGKTLAAGSTVLILPETMAQCVLTPDGESLAQAWNTISRTGHTHSELSGISGQMAELGRQISQLDSSDPDSEIAQFAAQLLLLSERIAGLETGWYPVAGEAEAAQLKTLVAEEARLRAEADNALSESLGAKLDAASVSTIPAGDKIPQADADGKIALGWLPDGVGDEASNALITASITEHDADPEAHAALFKSLSVGSASPVIGICCVEQGGGAGFWYNIDADGQPVSPTKSYFDHHPTYSAIRRVLIDGQVMQEHSKFYYKAFTIPSGPFAGKPGRLISPGQQDGFKVHPAFLHEGGETDHWWCGAYQATDEGADPNHANWRLMGSRPGKSPISNAWNPLLMYGYGRNEFNGVDGFGILEIYQLAELQLLMLIEAGTPDFQSFYGRGRVDTSSVALNNAADVATASWRGHVGLWGNVMQAIYGIELSSSNTIMILPNDGSRTLVNTGCTLPTSAGSYIASLDSRKGTGYDFNDIFLPGAVAAKASATIPDSFAASTAGSPCFIGGGANQGDDAGLFWMNFKLNKTGGGTYYGTRLAKRW